MQGVKRKLVYVTLYEAIAWLISTFALALLSGSEVSHTGPLSIIITLIAVSVNFLFTYAFEWWEKRQRSQERTLKRRILHAAGFQVCLVVFLIPLIAWWMNVSLVSAFLMDFTIMLIIPCYTFVYNYLFDKSFGLPSHVSQVKA